MTYLENHLRPLNGNKLDIFSASGAIVNDKSSSTISRFHQLSFLLVLLLIPILFIYRVSLVDSIIGTRNGLEGIYDTAILNADAPLLLVIGLLILGSWFPRIYTFAVALRFVALLLLLFYIADLIVFQQFGIRILFSSVQIYAAQSAPVWEQLQEFLGGRWIAILKTLLLGSCAFVLLFAPKKPWKFSMIFCMAVTTIAALIALMPWKVNYVNSWIVQNYLSANIFVTESRQYSEKMTGSVLDRPIRPLQCKTGTDQRKNVIILMVESLSSYQSQVFEGIYDWTPELDKLASEAKVFTNMHANGFATNEGLMGTLGGVKLFAPFSHMFRGVVPFQTAWGLEHTVPGEFNRAGYHTAFLTTGPLDFSKKGAWLTDIGFQEIEGNEQPFYEDWPKIQFYAAADEALYARSLDWIERRPSEVPWMLSMLTISSHQPYIDPETMQPDPEQAFRYADRQVAAFIRSLMSAGYFENGILLVLGDHRSMTPLLKEEEEKFGSEAQSKVPFLIFGEGFTGANHSIFQQSDLLDSFRHWLGSEVCEEGGLSSVFAEDKTTACAMHVRGSSHSEVDVFCPEGVGLVKLDGDDTRFVESEGINARKQDAVLQVIATQRLLGHKRHLRWLQAQ